MYIRKATIALAIGIWATSGQAQQIGVSEGEILFGQTAAVEGPAQALGNGMRHGILAAFE